MIEQDQNNGRYQIASHGMSGVWLHEQFPKMEKKNESDSPAYSFMNVFKLCSRLCPL
jgi:hypothetical protein